MHHGTERASSIFPQSSQQREDLEPVATAACELRSDAVAANTGRACKSRTSRELRPPQLPNLVVELGHALRDVAALGVCLVLCRATFDSPWLS